MSETRSIDLGREDELVPWSEWFRRAANSMKDILEKVPAPGNHNGAPRWVFRVTLSDGRTYAVTQVSTHISRGRCFLGENRWDVGPSRDQVTESAGKVASIINAGSPICDVITGYTMMGNGEDGLPTVLNVPPHMIASVEGVLLPRMLPQAARQQKEAEPFGFARWAAMQAEKDPQLTEVEEPASGHSEGAD